MSKSKHPSDVDEGMEGHAELQSAERHEMQEVIRDEEETEKVIEGAEHEEQTGRT